MAKEHSTSHLIHWPDHIVKYTFLTLLLIAVITTCWMISDGELSQLNEKLLGSIYQENHHFISSASDRAESMLITLSELHAGLMVLQSSQFGISFILDANVQLGHVLSQITDLVSHGRNYALYNLIALHIIDNLMHLIKWMTPWLLLLSETALLCLIAADSWLSTKNRWQMSLIRCSEATLAIAILLMIVIPSSVFLVSHSSKAVTEIFYNESYQAIVDTHEHILQDTDASSIKSEASSAISQFKSAKIKVSQKANYLATNITRYIAIATLEVLLLPLLFCGLMLWLSIALIKRHRHWQN